MAASVKSGVDRFLADERRKQKTINLDDYYLPYPMQANFHCSPARHRLLGGAAGPGKTLALIYDHLVACNEFSDSKQAEQVHTLLLRRTFPQLEATVITRFREKVPKELYRRFVNVNGRPEVTWHNGATTVFGSMQHEHDAWSYQGQWYKIGYDELGEFTFLQWNATAAWNRCPVSPWTTKDGASNPIGVGAKWIKSLFVDHRPCDEMDDAQRQQYHAEDYEYFPCTYLDNPIYANDPTFLANLSAYTGPVREALMLGKWGVAGGYFSGAWDPAENVYSAHDAPAIQPWHRRWLSADWGFEHWAAVYKHAMDDHGIIRTYGELCVKHQAPEVLAESIVNFALEDGRMPQFECFALSHDAFSSKATATMGANANSVARRMSPILQAAGLPIPIPSTRDKLGREQLMYQLLEKRIRTGEDAEGREISEPAWQIADTCTHLINVIPAAPRDDADPEKIAEFLGDDPLQGAGYGLYAIIGGPQSVPKHAQLAAKLEGKDPQAQAMAHRLFEASWKKQQQSAQSFRLPRGRGRW